MAEMHMVTITEKLVRKVFIEADDENDAIEKASNRYAAENIVLDADDFDGVSFVAEIAHTCMKCGKSLVSGYTNDCDFCSCDDCFSDCMDELYGKGNWKEAADDGQDGFYTANENGTGIYWTEW